MEVFFDPITKLAKAPELNLCLLKLEISLALVECFWENATPLADLEFIL